MCKSNGMVHTPRMELRKAACWSLRSLPARAGGERGCFSRLSHHAAIPLLAIVLASAATGRLSAGEGKVWQAGNYSFSDEMGGFTIRAIAGTGTRDNPIVIEEELHSASPVTMVIRAAGAGLAGRRGWKYRQRSGGEPRDERALPAHRHTECRRPVLDRIRVRIAGDFASGKRVRRWPLVRPTA